MAFGIKKSFFGKLKQKIEDVIFMRPEVDEDMLDELEEVLITSDIGMDTTLKIVSELREAVRMERLTGPEQVKERIAAIVERLVDKGERHVLSDTTPMIILVIGVNGGGKTTSIAKLANRYRRRGCKVLLAAADTFRAAAGEQLEIWAERADVSIVKHQEGADPSAVIFDAIQSAKAKGVDVVICDTAGRLQTKRNLMAELEKMNKIISREYPEAARETLLVLDATTGKNAVSQAREFGAVTDITGIVLTKMDGTAKGGIVITIADEFDLPVKFMGVGEKIDDFKVFDPREFAAGIFAEEELDVEPKLQVAAEFSEAQAREEEESVVDTQQAIHFSSDGNTRPARVCDDHIKKEEKIPVSAESENEAKEAKEAEEAKETKEEKEEDVKMEEEKAAESAAEEKAAAEAEVKVEEEKEAIEVEPEKDEAGEKKEKAERRGFWKLFRRQ